MPALLKVKQTCPQGTYVVLHTALKYFTGQCGGRPMPALLKVKQTCPQGTYGVLHTALKYGTSQANVEEGQCLRT